MLSKQIDSVKNNELSKEILEEVLERTKEPIDEMTDMLDTDKEMCDE